MCSGKGNCFSKIHFSFNSIGRAESPRIILQRFVKKISQFIDCDQLPSLEKTVPNYIYNMTKLRRLELMSFSMHGEIPVQLTTLSKLETLQLGGSNFFIGFDNYQIIICNFISKQGIWEFDYFSFSLCVFRESAL